MIGKRAYHQRVRTRAIWSVIAKAVGLKSGAMAREQAHNYASLHGLPDPPPELTKGEMAYEDREAGASWDEIRQCLGLKLINHAQHYARNYAKKHGKKWPILEQKDGN